MRTHAALHEAGQPITHGYFVNGGLATVLNVMADGKSIEVGLAGKEGFVGLPLVVGLSTSPTRVVAQVAGSAFRIRASDFAQALRRCPQLHMRWQCRLRKSPRAIGRMKSMRGWRAGC
jgi:CRP-like cAMP-binding protein